VWERGETPLSEILTSHEFWKLRMPLISVDGQALGAVVFYRHLFDGEPTVNLWNICGPLQRELGGALERLMT